MGQGALRFIESFELDRRDVELTDEAVWERLERSGFARSGAAAERLARLGPLGRSLVDPRALGRLLDASMLSDEERGSLPAPIQEAESLCFCLATAGQAIDERARALSASGELVDSMILDGIAAAALSLIANRLGEAIFDWAAGNGIAASRSFSPGGGSSGWALDRQRYLFDHLPENPLGVELTDRFLMSPSKSVSFVIGVGRSLRQAGEPFSCAGCERIDCTYRHVP